MKTKPVSKKRKYEPGILLEAYRRVFGTDAPAVCVLALERSRKTRRFVESICDKIVRERKEINQ